jgi:hypothetical protein
MAEIIAEKNKVMRMDPRGLDCLGLKQKTKKFYTHSP